jgi:hypothetical protein
MIERHGGLWLDPEGRIVFEQHDPQRDRIAVVCERADGRFQAWLYQKRRPDGLYCLPFWEPINDKAILPSEAEAMAYLRKLEGEVL